MTNAHCGHRSKSTEVLEISESNSEFSTIFVVSERLQRTSHRQRVENSLIQFPVVAIIRPRQLGKATLARLVFGR